MHSILLNPTDLLFFKDGRPMGHASSGHGSAWPLPHTLNAAFHAALHRAHLSKTSPHSHKGSAETKYQRHFGTLKSIGPFPVHTANHVQTWFFPRPLDAGGDDADPDLAKPVLLLAPIASHVRMGTSNLPAPLRIPVGSLAAPTKNIPPSWWSEGAWNVYLGTQPENDSAPPPVFHSDSDFSDSEHTYGIGINPETSTTEEGDFYSAKYLRLRESWRLGAFAGAVDHSFQDRSHPGDPLKAALAQSGNTIFIGGQQRTAHCEFSSRPLPLPKGKRSGFPEHEGRFLVKWVLLTPSIWPQIGRHAGGWLPCWIDQDTGSVLLKSGETERLQGERRESWRRRVAALPPLSARLVAAVVGKPLSITGFALPNEAAGRETGGAKSTLLAAPAGSVYYFEADSPDDASALAETLNWHGSDTASIRHLRSALMGEKGFGLGVCGEWNFHPASL